PRLECERVAILEEAHRELAHGGSPLASVGYAVDQEAARAADSFPAIVVESNRRLPLAVKVFIEGVEHFKERHILGHVLHLIADELPRRIRALLPPNSEGEIHGYL